MAPPVEPEDEGGDSRAARPFPPAEEPATGRRLEARSRFPPAMIRATSVVRRLAVKPALIADRITLDHEARGRRRLAMTTDGGLAFLLDLARPANLNDGDALALEDGRLVEVHAAEENLIEVTAETPLRLAKIAWHLGNRHTPAEVTESAIYVAPDHVLVEMVRGLGGMARAVRRPFRPEVGAYGHDHA